MSKILPSDVLIINTQPRIRYRFIGEQFVKDFAEYYHNGLTNIERSNHDIEYWLEIFKSKK